MATRVRELLAEPAAGEDLRPSDRGPLLLCAWSGPMATFLAFLGLLVIGHFIFPAQSPSESARTIARFYAAHTTRIRLGMLVTMFGFTLLVPFGIAVAILTRRIERRPVLTYIQVACVAIAALEGVMTTFIFAAAAFRPDAIDPQITRTLNDLGWFAFLFDIPPFTLWIGCVGYAVLRDRGPQPVFPRWVGYFNLWVALLILPGDAMAFFKHGPFGFNGLLALYLPAGLFFVWVVTMTPLVLSAIRRDPGDACESPGVGNAPEVQTS